MKWGFYCNFGCPFVFIHKFSCFQLIIAIVPAYEMFAVEFEPAAPNASEIRQLLSTALSANTLDNNKIKLM